MTKLLGGDRRKDTLPLFPDDGFVDERDRQDDRQARVDDGARRHAEHEDDGGRRAAARDLIIAREQWARDDARFAAEDRVHRRILDWHRRTGPLDPAGEPESGRLDLRDRSAAMVAVEKPGLNLRRLGGSDMAAVMGCSDYGGPLKVYARIVDGVETGETKSMRRGKVFERGIAQLWIAEHHPDWKLAWFPDFIGSDSIEHPHRAWQRFSPDCLVWTGSEIAIADMKRSHRAYERHGAAGTDQVAAYELIQATTYLEALRSAFTERGLSVAMPDAPRGAQLPSKSFVVVHDLDSDEILEWVVPYDDELGSKIVEAGERFWRDHVVPRKPPELDASYAAKLWLETRFPHVKAPLRDATPAEDDMARALRKIGDQKRALKEIENELKNELRLRIADARGIRGDWGSILWTEMAETTVREHTRESGRRLAPYWRKTA